MHALRELPSSQNHNVLRLKELKKYDSLLYCHTVKDGWETRYWIDLEAGQHGYNRVFTSLGLWDLGQVISPFCTSVTYAAK